MSDPKIDKTAVKKKGLFQRPVLYIIILAVVSITLFYDFVFSGKMLYGSDTLGALDGKVFFVECLKKYGEYPAWLNTRLSGTPTIDALYGDTMYAPSVLLYRFLSLPKALGYKLLLHVFLAGVFFFLLLKKGFKAPVLVAFAGGLFYMLSPQMVSYVYPGHDGKIFVMAWLPFIIWRLKELLDRPGLMNMTLFSIGISMSLFTSHIQMTYFMLWGVFFYWVMHSLLLWKEKKSIKGLLPTASFFWGGVFLALGVAFIAFYPGYSFVQDGWSVRGVDRGIEHAASWSIHWPDVLSLIIPEFCGHNIGNVNTYWSQEAFKLNSEYPGIVPLVLAVLALVFSRKPWRIFWAGTALFFVLYALGKHTPVWHIAYAIIPGVNKFRAGSMIMFWFSFCVIILSSFSLRDIFTGRLDSFTEDKKKLWQKRIIICASAVVVFSLLFSIKSFVLAIFEPITPSLSEPQKAALFDTNFTEHFVPMLWLFCFFSVSILAMLLLYIKGKTGKNLFISVLIVIALIDTFRVDRKFINTINPGPYFKNIISVKNLLSDMKDKPFRCFSLPGTFPRNGAGAHGLEDVGGFHDNELLWYRKYRGDQQNRNYFMGLVGRGPQGGAYLKSERLKSGNNFLSAANAKYILTRQKGKIYTIENENAFGRISFAEDYEVMTEDQILAAFKNGSRDITEKVTLLEEPDIDFKPGYKDSDSAEKRDVSVKWEKYEPNYRKAVVDVPANGFLRISEVWYPGWEIRIDGEKVKYYRADITWMAVGIEKGSHEVEILPHSLYLKQAGYVSFPLIALLAAYWLVSLALTFYRRKKNARKEESTVS